MPASLTTRVLTKASSLSPEIRRYLWRVLYNILSSRYKKHDWNFINYGYVEEQHCESASNLLQEDWKERYSIYLYERTCRGIDMKGLNVLEVGAGRGGGCSYIARYKHPESVLGIDFSKKSIDACIRLHSSPIVSFELGDAEKLAYADRMFDVVINVESSHCYGSAQDFFSEAYRVLKPGGYLLWTDFRSKEHLEMTMKQIQEARFQVLSVDDITSNVLHALDLMNDYKERVIREQIPLLIRNSFRDFAGMKGARVYESMRNGRVVYLTAILQKSL